jgi:hypothetical protein
MILTGGGVYKCSSNWGRKWDLQNWKGPETRGATFPLLFNLVGDALNRMLVKAS